MQGTQLRYVIKFVADMAIRVHLRRAVFYGASPRTLLLAACPLPMYGMFRQLPAGVI
jgi:hypothetical protein